MKIDASLVEFGELQIKIMEGESGDKLKVKDVRLGLGYSCVELSNGSSGLAWTPSGYSSPTCSRMREAGTFKGRSASEILQWLTSDNVLQRAAGVAVFNAVNSNLKREYDDDEAVSLLNIQANEKVVMVGYFAPVIPKVEATGCSLKIMELDSGRSGTVSQEEGHGALAECDVAIITATSIINNTIDGLLASLKKNRAAVILGPSTPMCPEVFKGKRISQLSGSIVQDIESVKTVVSEGGGTKNLKKHLRFASVSCN